MNMKTDKREINIVFFTPIQSSTLQVLLWDDRACKGVKEQVEVVTVCLSHIVLNQPNVHNFFFLLFRVSFSQPVGLFLNLSYTVGKAG